PTPLIEKDHRADNWIEVGASSYKKSSSLPAYFSNFGKNSVDIFAPGVNIHSTFPHQSYGTISGTSMAAPVVSGVAALLWGLDPKLKAQELKNIITETATR